MERNNEFRKYERRVKTPEQALASLMSLCSKSEKSSGDAMRLMRGWGVEESERGRVLETLIKQKFVDDSRYAGAFVREKVKLSGWGVYKIKMALVNKGVAKEIIDRALEEYADKGVMDTRLDERLAVKIRSIKSGTPYEIKGKLMRFGLSLGFEYESVMSAVEKIIKDEE